MRSFLVRLLALDIDPTEDIDLQREHLLTSLLRSATILGVLLYFLAFIPVLEKKLPLAILGIYTIFLLWIFLITFLKKLPSSVRQYGFLTLFFILGTYNLLYNGFNVDAGLFFLTCVAFTTLFLDLRGGLMVMGFCCLTVFITGGLIVGHLRKPSMELPQTNLVLWVIGGLIFFLMGTLLVTSIFVLLRNLRTNLFQSRQKSDELQESLKALREKEEYFRSLIENSTDLTGILSRDGTIRYLSPSVERMLGYRPEELIGSNIFPILLRKIRQSRGPS
jgi:PAS domain-containing protein